MERNSLKFMGISSPITPILHHSKPHILQRPLRNCHKISIGYVKFKNADVMIKKIKVRIVDDEYMIAKEISVLFEMMDLDVCELAGRGEEAIEIARREKPDIALIDIRLGGDMDGIRTAHKIKEFAEIPIIFMSGDMGDAHEEAFKDLAPVAYYNKPISAQEIAEKIREVVG